MKISSSAAPHKRNPTEGKIRGVAVERLSQLKGVGGFSEPLTIVVSTPNAVTQLSVLEVLDVNLVKGVATLKVTIPLDRIRS